MDFLKIARECGMLVEDDGIPINAVGQKDTSTDNLPAYAADEEARKRRQTIIRRLHKLLKARDERIARYEVKKAMSESDQPDVDNVNVRPAPASSKPQCEPAKSHSRQAGRCEISSTTR